MIGGEMVFRVRGGRTVYGTKYLKHHQDRQWDYNLKNRIRKYDNLGEVLQLMRRVVSVLS